MRVCVLDDGLSSWCGFHPVFRSRLTSAYPPPRAPSRAKKLIRPAPARGSQLGCGTISTLPPLRDNSVVSRDLSTLEHDTRLAFGCRGLETHPQHTQRSIRIFLLLTLRFQRRNEIDLRQKQLKSIWGESNPRFFQPHGFNWTIRTSRTIRLPACGGDGVVFQIERILPPSARLLKKGYSKHEGSTSPFFRFDMSLFCLSRLGANRTRDARLVCLPWFDCDLLYCEVYRGISRLREVLTGSAGHQPGQDSRVASIACAATVTVMQRGVAVSFVVFLLSFSLPFFS